MLGKVVHVVIVYLKGICIFKRIKELFWFTYFLHCEIKFKAEI